MPNKKVEMTPEGDILVDGERYTFSRDKIKKIDKIPHLDKKVFRKVTDDEEKKYRNTIVKEFAKRVKKEELIEHLLKDVPINKLKQMATNIKKKQPVKKHHGCIGFKVGKSYLQLVD